MFVDPLPVTVTPILALVLGADGKVHAGVRASATEESSVLAGAEYKDDSARPIGEATSRHSFEPPRLSLGGALRGRAGPHLKLLVFGLADPETDVDAYLLLEADLLAQPWWELYAGIKASAALRMEVFSHRLIDAVYPSVIGYRPLLEQAELPPPSRDPSLMLEVPAGPFQMGCDPSLPYALCESDQLLLHTVTLNAFRIDTYETTNARYAACVQADHCTPQSVSSYTHAWYYGNPEFAEYPVIGVNWLQAQQFCQWSGKRLPTEAEWEKAARGSSDTRMYPWGSVLDEEDCTMANYATAKTT